MATGSHCTDNTYVKNVLFKDDFFTEHHLELITDFRYRTAITKLRCSSHALEIERGRHQNPKGPKGSAPVIGV